MLPQTHSGTFTFTSALAAKSNLQLPGLRAQVSDMRTSFKPVLHHFVRLLLPFYTL